MIDDTVLGSAAALLAALHARGLTVTTAESCTGGLIAGAITAIPGSSASLEAGFVTYSNLAKQRMIGVPESLLIAHGAVSEPVARAMAEGARAVAGADLALACTGIAGPGGGVPGKPVGTVFIAAAVQGETRVLHRIFPGDRAAIRAATVAEAIDLGLMLVTRP
ncbi:MAG TPA: CinA family protein [Roseomonas sp.]|jgi:nicotinamide-nucleotide amidase